MKAANIYYELVTFITSEVELGRERRRVTTSVSWVSTDGRYWVPVKETYNKCEPAPHLELHVAQLELLSFQLSEE